MYVNKFIRTRTQFEKSLDNGVFFQQIDTTVNNDSLSDIPDILDSTADQPDLSTINIDELHRLCEEELPGETRKTTSSTQQDVGVELIGKCVTPSRIKSVQDTLRREREWHLCALKLLPSFFSKEELASSNTDGTYDKKCLDSTKLNSLKLLVFTKFPACTNDEKDRAWRFIKGKINCKCRAIRKSLVKDSSPVRSV